MDIPKFTTLFTLILLITVPALAQNTSHVRRQDSKIVTATRLVPVQPKQDSNTRHLTTPSIQNLAFDNMLPSEQSASSMLRASIQLDPELAELDYEVMPESTVESAMDATKHVAENAAQSGLEPVLL